MVLWTMPRQWADNSTINGSSSKTTVKKLQFKPEGRTKHCLKENVTFKPVCVFKMEEAGIQCTYSIPGRDVRV